MNNSAEDLLICGYTQCKSTILVKIQIILKMMLTMMVFGYIAIHIILYLL